MVLNKVMEYLDTIITSIRNGILVVDKNHIITYVNPAAEEMSKRKREGMVGQHCYEVFHALEAPCKHVQCPLREVLGTGEAHTVLHKHIDFEGREYVVEIDATPIRNQEGEIIYILMIERDVTEQKKAEERFNEIQKQLIQFDKMSTLGEFIADLVHDLNNPLASVLGYAQLLLPKITDPEIKDDLEKIVTEAERASHVVKNLAAFSSRRIPEKEVVDLNELVEMTFDVKAFELNHRNIRVTKELSPSIPLTKADPHQIQHVLLNLINNAEKAISGFHGFGEIRVETRVLGDKIEIVVSDDGPGIPKENIPKIFDPFFTTKGKNTGLGLSISYNIITEHGGEMRVESEWGEGSTFIITLPIIEVEDEEKKEKKERIERGLKGVKGLVIDDELAILYLVSEYLEKEGCQIETAQDAKTALNIIEEKDFDFVICDIKMPEISGEDFYHIVEEKRPDLKDRIIFLTGDVLSNTTKTFIETTKNPYVAKPFILKELKKVVINIVGNNKS